MTSPFPIATEDSADPTAEAPSGDKAGWSPHLSDVLRGGGGRGQVPPGRVLAPSSAFLIPVLTGLPQLSTDTVGTLAVRRGLQRLACSLSCPLLSQREEIIAWGLLCPPTAAPTHPSVLGLRSTACRVVLGGPGGCAQGPRAGPFFTGSVASGGSELGVCTGAWGQAASNAGSGVAPTAPGQCREEGIHQGPKPPGGLAPPTHRTPPGGGAGETPVGPRKRISPCSPAQGWSPHSWKLERGQGWSTHPWALPAAASAPLTLEACLPTQHCLPRLPAFKLLPRGPRMPQASVFPMLSLSWALHPLSPPGLLPRPQQEGCSCRRARPCCLP